MREAFTTQVKTLSLSVVIQSFIKIWFHRFYIKEICVNRTIEVKLKFYEFVRFYWPKV